VLKSRRVRVDIEEGMADMTGSRCRMPVVVTVVALVAVVAAAPGSATFPGANGSVVLPRNGDGHPLLVPGGRVLHRISDAQRLVWSRDGRRLLVTTYRAIFVTNVSGRRLTRYPSLVGSFGGATWTRLEDGVIYGMQTKHCSGALVEYRFADRSRTQITACDGARLAAASPATPFVAYRTLDDALRIMDLRDGTIRTVLAKPEGTLGTGVGSGAAAPSWSPDGRFLAYSTGTTVAIFDARTGEQRDLLPRVQWPTEGPGSVAWSPDGLKIAYTLDDNDTKAQLLYVVDADGSNVRRLSASDYGPPDWQPLAH
jgi:Tol biopolymer transport system component